MPRRKVRCPKMRRPSAWRTRPARARRMRQARSPRTRARAPRLRMAAQSSRSPPLAPRMSAAAAALPGLAGLAVAPGPGPVPPVARVLARPAACSGHSWSGAPWRVAGGLASSGVSQAARSPKECRRIALSMSRTASRPRRLAGFLPPQRQRFGSVPRPGAAEQGIAAIAG